MIDAAALIEKHQLDICPPLESRHGTRALPWLVTSPDGSAGRGATFAEALEAWYKLT